MKQMFYILLLLLGVQGFSLSSLWAQYEVRRFWQPQSTQTSGGVEVAEQGDQVQQQPMDIISTLGESSSTHQRLYPSVGTLNFLDAFNTQSPLKVRRGFRNLWKWPTVKVDNKTQLACGSAHIRDYRSDAYMHEVSACMLAGAAQEWRRTMCPLNTPDCQLMFGDMSYGKKKPRSWPHKSHKMGHCVDVWPIRKLGNTGEVNRFSAGYDRERTKKLIEIFHKWGSDKKRSGSRQIFFNDPVIVKANLTRRFRNHDDHIHVCFRPTKENKEKCQQTKFDPLLCPELSSPGQYKQHLNYLSNLSVPSEGTSVN